MSEAWFQQFKAKADREAIVARTLEAVTVGESVPAEVVSESIRIIQDAIGASSTLAESQAVATAKYSRAWLEFVDTHRVERGERLAREVTLLLESLPRGARILDVGCGDGMVAALLARQGYRVVCCDAADYRLDEAKALPFLEINGDGDYAFVEDKTWDACIVLYVFHHMDQSDQDALLRRLFQADIGRLLVFEDAHADRDDFADRDALLNNFMQGPPAAVIPMPRTYKTVDGWKDAFNAENKHLQQHTNLPKFDLAEHGKPSSAGASICHYFHLVRDLNSSDDDSVPAAVTP